MVGRESLTAQPLRQQKLNGPTVTTRVHTKEVRKDAVAGVLRQIHQTASAETKIIYELVSSEQDNWIVRWMLWHVSEGGVQSSVAMKRESGSESLGSPANGRSGDLFFDPVRDR